MYTHRKRIGVAAVFGLLALGMAECAALAQDQPPAPANPPFRIGQAQPGLNGAGAARAQINNPGGFNYSLSLANAPGGAYGLMSSSPYSGITSSPYSESGGGGYGYGYGDPYSGYMQGAASVIDSQGRYLINTQRAYLLKEQVRQSQLDYRRRLFDEWLYERANTPSRADEIERSTQRDLQYLRFNPDKTEVWSGRALNVILDDLKRVDRGHVPGGDRTVDENVLKKINVSSGKGSANLGVLKNDGKIDWPLGLRDPQLGQEGDELRRQIQTLTTKAFNEAKDGRQPDPGTIKEIRASLKQLEKVLRGSVGAIEFSQYVEAKNYLKQLNDAVNLLTEKNAADYINGKFSLANLKNNTVADVVRYMADNGLQFAPAVDGEQEAYSALHRALANYDVAANSIATEQPRQ
jgi:hypothetical protein